MYRRLVVKHNLVLVPFVFGVGLTIGSITVVSVYETVVPVIETVIEWEDVPLPTYEELSLDALVAEVLAELDAIEADDTAPSPMLSELLSLLA